MNPTTTPQVGDVRSVSGNQTNFVTSRNLANTPPVETPPVETPAVNASNVPASIISAPQPALTLPPAPALQTDTAVQGEAKTLLEQSRLQAEQSLANAKAPVSASERAIQEAMGILSTEADTRTKLEDQAGLTQRSEQIKRFEESLRRQSAALDQFDIDLMNDTESMRLEAGSRDMTKGQFSARSAELNLQRSIERAGRVAGMRADIAALDVMQSNYKQAAEQVDKAMKAIYEPVRQQLKMEMFFLERNDKRFDSAQKELANFRMIEIQREQQQMERVENSVNDAINTGAVTGAEVKFLADPNVSNAEKLAMSQLIRSRSASELRGLQTAAARADLALKSEQLAKLRTPVVATRETKIEDIGGTKKLIDTQTGEIIATFGADVSTNEIAQAKQASFVNSIDTLKTHAGISKAVGVVGLARFTPFKADVLSGQVSEFTGSVEQIVKQLTLNTFAEAKEKGITFGAMTAPEWAILGDSATKINSWRRERDDGSIYYATSESAFKRELNVLSNFAKIDSIRKGVNPADIGVLDLGNNTYATRNSDGTFTEFVIRNGEIGINQK